MANIERIYTIPMGAVFEKRHTKRAKNAVVEIIAFTQRHMKSTNVRMGTALNRHILKAGMQNIPRRIKVTAIKDDITGEVWVNLFGARPDEKPVAVAPAKKAEKPAAEAKPAEKRDGKPHNEAEEKAEKEAIKADLKK